MSTEKKPAIAEFIVHHRILELSGLGLILVLALLLRLRYIDYLSPEFMDLDEVRTVGTSLGMIQHRTFDPHFNHYPPVSLYLNAGWYLFWGLIIEHRGLQSTLAWLDGLKDTSMEMIFLARYLSLIAGLLTITGLHFLARRYAGMAGGLLAALFLALNTHHIFMSDNSKIDMIALVFATFGFLAFSILFETHKMRWYVLSAVFTGLFFMTKFNYSLCWISFLLPVGLAMSERKSLWTALWDKRMLLHVLVLLAVVFGSSPYWIMDLAENLEMMSWILYTSIFMSFYHIDPHNWWLDRYFLHIMILFPFVYGSLIFFMAIAGCMAMARDFRWSPKALLIWGNLLVFTDWFASVSGGCFPYYHYFHLQPLFMTLGAYLPARFLSRKGYFGKSKNIITRYAGLALILAIVLTSVCRMDNYRTWLYGNYDQAGAWMQKHVPARARTVVISVYEPGAALGLPAAENVWPHLFTEEMLAEKRPDVLVCDSRAFAGFRKLYRGMSIAPRLDAMLTGRDKRYKLVQTFTTHYPGEWYFSRLDTEHKVELYILTRSDFELLP